VEILVSFHNLPVGGSAVLRSLAFPIVAPLAGPAGPRQGDALDILTFHVDSAGGPTALPSSLPGPILTDPAEARRTRTFNLGTVNATHTINGVTYDLNRTDFSVPAGEVEIWEFVNGTNNYHPMHAHGAHFRVLTRNGAPAALPADRGWRDTVLVYPNETVRVAVRFGGRPGLFVLHCHNLEHEHEMMQNFAVTVPAPPTLESRREGPDMVVRWPAPADGWVLETSSDLRQWNPAPGVATLAGGWFEWRTPSTGAASFYRLTLP
jgi:blue copper oxidase